MTNMWKFELINAIKWGIPPSISDDEREKIRVPRKVKSWFDVYKLLLRGFLWIEDIGDGMVEVYDWADSSEDRFLVVGRISEIEKLIMADKFPRARFLHEMRGGESREGEDNSNTDL